MVCPLAQLSAEHSVTAVEASTTQRLLNSIPLRESPHISSGLGRVSMWRVGASDKITSDTYGARCPLRPESLRLRSPEPSLDDDLKWMAGGSSTKRPRVMRRNRSSFFGYRFRFLTWIVCRTREHVFPLSVEQGCTEA